MVLGTLSRTHRLDENSNGNMAALVACLEHLALETGASVLSLHHVGKGSAREGATGHQGPRGVRRRLSTMPGGAGSLHP